MDEKTQSKELKRFRLLLTAAAVVCILTFAVLAVFMSSRSAGAISGTGQFYMQGLSDQISRHFETIIQLRLQQLESLVDAIDVDLYDEKDDLYDEIERLARANEFDHVALLSAIGNVQMVYGRRIEILDFDSFLVALNNDEVKVTLGIDSDGAHVALLGVSVAYPMRDGSQSTALIVALPVDYLTNTLNLEIDDHKTYSFIIRENGSFVVRTAVEQHDNYFDRVADVYTETNGITPDEFTVAIKSAMASGEPFSGEMIICGEKRQVYCVKLENSEWFLLTFMPYGVLNSIIDKLSNQWLAAAFFGGLIVVIAISAVLLSYIRSKTRHMKELEYARHRAEDAQKKAESASRAKSDFLSNVSHDIRTPMNAIVGMTTIARSNIDDSNKVARCLEKIEISSKHLLGLINNVLDMSKIENGKMLLSNDEVSLRETMDNMVSIVNPQIKAKNQKFEVNIQNIISEYVFCDCVRLNQIIINLLSNAVKFTPDGGTISFGLYQEPSSKGDEYVSVCIVVKDTGIGMSETTKNVIFDPFVREDNARVRQIEGTGLGMAITKHIVDAMEGTIEVDSTLGKGSEFRVRVDFKKIAKDELVDDMKLPAWNILVVDDDVQFCESIVEELQELGVHADYTLEGITAISKMTELADLGSNYDAVLIDWHLPDSSGIDTARRIRELFGAQIPLLFMSAYDCSDIEDEAYKAGITDIVSKPLFKSTLYHELKKAIGNDHHESETSVPFEQRFAGKRVLLAEDNELNWEIASDMLSELGLIFDWAQNGKICYDKFIAAPANYYDAVFMDLRMPVMNGYDATEAIRSSDKPDAGSIPIIAMSADAFSDDVKRCLDCGMNAHVAKPIDIREVENLLAKYL